MYSPCFTKTTGRGTPNGGITAGGSFNIIPGIGSIAEVPVLYGWNWNGGFNDMVNGSFHYFRIEEIKTMRVPTFRRVGIIYRDLGVATIQIALSAVNDSGAVVYNTPSGGAPSPTNAYPSFTIGTAAASQRLVQKFLDTRITGSLPQLGILRAAGAGPVSISKMWLSAEVEEVTL
jgi:hypothetical protein